MSKFKSGDKVKVVSVKSPRFWYAKNIGKEFTLTVQEGDNWYTKEDMTGMLWEGDIELVNKDWVDGVPQVGTICEAWHSSHRGWCEAKVLDVCSDESGVIIAARELDTGYLFWTHDFRPLKAQEEIAAEEEAKERDNIIKELTNFLSNQPCDDYYTAIALYDAGYRLVKQE